MDKGLRDVIEDPLYKQGYEDGYMQGMLDASENKQLSRDAQMNPQILEDFWNEK